MIRTAALITCLLPSAVWAQAADNPATAPAPSQSSSTTGLSLADAIQRALSSAPLALETAAAQVRSAENNLRAGKAATALVVEGKIDARVLRIDLRELGLDIPRFPLTNPPQYVGTNGPYFIADPRLSATKVLIDAAAHRKIAVGQSAVTEASDAVAEQREQIASETAREYLLALRTSRKAELAADNLALRKRLLLFAEEQAKQDLAAPADLRHARMDANTAQSQLSASRLEQTRALLRLMYLIGGRYGDTLDLTDSLSDRPVSLTLDQALTIALEHTPKLKTLAARAQTLKLQDRSISGEALPTLQASGDVGPVVVAPNPSGNPGAAGSYTYDATLELRVPILDGHRRAIEHAGVASEERQLDAQTRDARRSVELQVRLAYAALTQANEQLGLARTTLSESEEAVLQAEAAHTAGTGSGIELDRVRNENAAAADAVVEAVYNQELARLGLAEASGTVASLQW